MLIRISGHHDGIKAYLEKGQKQDREFSRDEMDERVILAGDLDITNDIIQSMDTDAERYKTITLSFKEDDIEPETLDAIVREFEAFAFAAYKPDEYCFYAEAHLPKIKSYTDRKTGEAVERKPHIHFVIPKINLLSGRKLDPFAMVEHQATFIDAFQEHINHKYGLASPKDNRRVAFTSASEMISRYKGDAFDGGFGGNNRELKAAILEAVLARDITGYDDFRALLQAFGETRTRNAGRSTEYENVKPAGAAKGVNLKEYVFSRAFVELPADGKRAVIERTFEPEYETAGAARATPKALQDTLREWHEVRAKEVKYFNGGNLNAYPFYRDAAPDVRRQLLAAREQRFYQRFRGEMNHERGIGRSSEQRGGRATEKRLSGDVGRGYRFKPRDEPDIERGGDRERGAGDAGHERDKRAGRSRGGREPPAPNDRRVGTGRRPKAVPLGDFGQIISLTLSQIDPGRRPNPSTVCEVCPASVWMATPREVKCYCRLMHLVSWKTSEPVDMTHCDGMALASEA